MDSGTLALFCVLFPLRGAAHSGWFRQGVSGNRPDKTSGETKPTGKSSHNCAFSKGRFNAL